MKHVILNSLLVQWIAGVLGAVSLFNLVFLTLPVYTGDVIINGQDGTSYAPTNAEFIIEVLVTLSFTYLFAHVWLNRRKNRPE